jgi:hypothetical protein
MPTANRYAQRYGSTPTRTCVTQGCNRDAPPTAMSGRCSRCSHNFKRYSDPLIVLPKSTEIDPWVRRAEEQRGRLSHRILEALRARWDIMVSECRGRATPSYQKHGKLSYSKWDQAAYVLIRGIADNLSFERVLDLLTAIHLRHLERPFTHTEESLACVTVELMRRAAGPLGRHITDMRHENGTIRRSYRGEVSRQVRLSAAGCLEVALGGAALALAKREAARAGEAKAVRSDYYDAVRAIEAAA